MFSSGSQSPPLNSHRWNRELDFDSEIAAELEAALTLRPGLDLYGVHGRPVAPFGSAGSKSFVDLAPFHWCLPDELLFKIFAKMTPYDLGKAACVCQKWEYAVHDPVFWRNACLKDWQIFGKVENYKILQSEYDGSWKKMWLLRSRVRTDGFYVNRHTYISAQFAGRNVRNRVVKYSFRYLRFYPSGGLLCKTTSKEVKDLAKLMNFRASKAECVCNGHYMLSDDRVEATFFPRGLQHNVWRICLRLGGTKVGANDRMDLLSLVVSSVNDGEVPSTNEDPLFAVPDGTDIWGLTHFIFVPFEEQLGCRYPTTW